MEEVGQVCIPAERAAGGAGSAHTGPARGESVERQQGEIHVILLLLWFCVFSAAMFSTMHDAFSILW